MGKGAEKETGIQTGPADGPPETAVHFQQAGGDRPARGKRALRDRPGRREGREQARTADDGGAEHEKTASLQAPGRWTSWPTLTWMS